MISNYFFISQYSYLALLKLAMCFVLAILATFSTAHAQGGGLIAGTVTALKGKADVQRQGTIIPLAIGSSVLSGDAISTKKYSTLHMRMTDGANITLDPVSTLQLKDYRVTQEQNKARSLVALVSGGLRTVTGWIGNLHNDRQYQVQTPTTIIGVRGTEYSVKLGAFGTRATVHDGTVAMCNDAGCVNVTQGQAGVSKKIDELPLVYIDKVVSSISADEAIKQNYIGTNRLDSGSVSRMNSRSGRLSSAGEVSQAIQSSPTYSSPSSSFGTIGSFNDDDDDDDDDD